MAFKAIGDDGRLAPVLVQVIVLVSFIAGVAGGYWIRMQLESRAELSVVLDDEHAVQEIERETERDLNTHAAAMEAIREIKVDECFTSTPLPDDWFDIVQPVEQQEE